MPNLANVLKQEIARLARKEVRQQTVGTKRLVTQQKRDIAALKRKISGLETRLAELEARIEKPAHCSVPRTCHTTSFFSQVRARSSPSTRHFGGAVCQAAGGFHANGVSLGAREISATQGPTGEPRELAALGQTRSLASIGSIGAGVTLTPASNAT